MFDYLYIYVYPNIMLCFRQLHLTSYASNNNLKRFLFLIVGTRKMFNVPTRNDCIAKQNESDDMNINNNIIDEYDKLVVAVISKYLNYSRYVRYIPVS